MESIGKIALIHEPYLNAFTKQPSGFFKESKLFVGAKKNAIRACILTDNSVNAWQINQFCNNDMVTIGIKNDNITYILCSLYMPYEQRPPPGNLAVELERYCKTKGWKLLICSDANSHSCLWGSSDDNERGVELADWVLSSDLHIYAIKVMILLFSTALERRLLMLHFVAPTW